jgi:hypothetical protein
MMRFMLFARNRVFNRLVEYAGYVNFREPID